MKLKNKKERGVGLVEMLVAMVVFGLIMITLGNVVFSVVKAQRRTFAYQNTQETSRFLLEMMAKEIRTSIINTSEGSGLTVLNITNADSETLDYQFDNTNKRLLRDYRVVSSDDIELTGYFYVQEYASPARKVVTITMKIEATGNKSEEVTIINLQNTVAPRSY